MSSSDQLQQLREWMSRSSISHRDIAVATGVPYHTLTKIARGATKNPRYSTVRALLQYFEQHSDRRLISS